MDWHDPKRLIELLAVGVLTGWVASKIVQGKGMGLIPDMVVGIVGALLGGYLANFFHFPMDNWWETFAVYVLGSVVLLVGIRLLKPAN